MAVTVNGGLFLLVIIIGLVLNKFWPAKFEKPKHEMNISEDQVW